MKEIKINNDTYLIDNNLIVDYIIESDKLPYNPSSFTLVKLNRSNKFHYYNGSCYRVVECTLKENKENIKIKTEKNIEKKR